jgi:hypothetical protein
MSVQTEVQTISMLSQPGRQHDTVRRILWIVNHKTLMSGEVPLLRSLGFEVFVPKIVPAHDRGFRSAGVTYDYDAALDIAPAALRVLNDQNFFEQCWAPTVAQIVNRYFDVIVCHFTYYTTPLREAALKFQGLLFARAFGRESPLTYGEFRTFVPHPSLLEDIRSVGRRFIFAQAYDNLAEIEEIPLRSRAHTITVPLPEFISAHADTWTGTGSKAVFLCPAIASGGYYKRVYQAIKRDFGDLPHVIFGSQTRPVNDPAVLPFLSDDALADLYRSAPVFVYSSPEPRHVHYSPLEAMVVGTPVLYLEGGLIDRLAGARLPGACADVSEMKMKARRLVEEDRALAEEIRSEQGRVLETFAPEVVKRQWASALFGGGAEFSIKGADAKCPNPRAGYSF